MVDTAFTVNKKFFICTFLSVFGKIEKRMEGRASGDDMAEKNKIRFTINGKTYTLLHDEPEEYMHRIEHYLNTKVAAASKSGIQLGEQTAIVMASISITDELFKTQKNFNTLRNEIKRMMDEYDRLKIEKQELDEQLAKAEQQIDTLSKQLLLARHGASPDQNFAAERTNESVSGSTYLPANHDMYDES